MKQPRRTQLKLPELQQADLDKSTVHSFLEDLEQVAEVLTVILKTGPGKANPDPMTLSEGTRQFLAGQARGLQIRYRSEDTEWCDTLMKTTDGYRITRMQQPHG